MERKGYITTYEYQTPDRQAYFKFGLYQNGYIVEIDILYMPSYNYRDTGLHYTHRLTSERGGYKICFGDPTVSNNVYTARIWAEQWAKHTWNYIRYGKEFPNV